MVEEIVIRKENLYKSERVLSGGSAEKVYIDFNLEHGKSTIMKEKAF